MCVYPAACGKSRHRASPAFSVVFARGITDVLTCDILYIQAWESRSTWRALRRAVLVDSGSKVLDAVTCDTSAVLRFGAWSKSVSRQGRG